MGKKYDHKLDLDDDGEVEIDLGDSTEVVEKPLEVEVADEAPEELEVIDEAPEPEPAKPSPPPSPPPVRQNDDTEELRRDLRELRQRLAEREEAEADYGRQAQMQDIDSKIADARARLKKAHEDGDIEATITATDELTDLKGEKLVMRERQAQLKEQREAAARQPKPQPQQPKQEVNPLSQKWLAVNDWYGKKGNETETMVARAIDVQMFDEGWRPDSEGYFDEMNKRIASKVRTVRPVGLTQKRDTVPPVGAPRAASEVRAKPGTVRLEKSDLDVMRMVGMDPESKKDRIAYARQKANGKGEIQ